MNEIMMGYICCCCGIYPDSVEPALSSIHLDRITRNSEFTNGLQTCFGGSVIVLKFCFNI